MTALLAASPVIAQDVTEQRADLKRRIADRRAELEALKSQKVGVLELLEISEKMALASRKRAQLLEGELRAIRLRVAIAERDEALAREEVNAVLEELSPRLQAMYRMRRRAPLDTLLSSGDFASLVWRARAMKTLVARDAELLAQARLAVTFVERSRKQAQKLRGWMATRLESLRGETGQAEVRRLEFVDLLSYVKAEAVQSSRVIKELERAERQLSSLITEMESTVSTSGFGALRGKLSLPTHGVMEVGFGKVVNPRFNTVTVQKGVDIRAP
ncbi:MAG: murein hydrolase activator EnvC family protein, partial [Myxococcaceae bacterium]